MPNHRASRRPAPRGEPTPGVDPSSTPAASGGRRKAHRTALVARLRSLLPHGAGTGRTLPSAPAALGAGVLVVAAAGAAVVGHGSLVSSASEGSVQAISSQVSAVPASSRVATTSSVQARELAVSRDSRREVIETVAEEELEQVAEAQARERSAALAELAASAERHAARLAERLEARAWVLPIRPGAYRITAGFGLSSSLWSSTHTGLDFAAPSGTPVVSVAQGKVTSAEYAGAYGNRVVVTLRDGTEIWYCHLTSFGARPGEAVAAGEVVGTVGSTGNSTGPHLHLEVRPGGRDPVDPYAALAGRGLQP